MIDAALVIVGLLALVVATLLVVGLIFPRVPERLLPRVVGSGRRRLRVLLVFGAPLLALVLLLVVLAALPQYTLEYDEAASVVAGEAGELPCWVNNVGASGGTFTAPYSVDGIAQSDVSLRVEGGSAAELRLPVPATLTAGKHVATVGDARIFFTAKRPAEYKVVSLNVDRPVAKVGQTVKVTAEVTNIGESPGEFEGSLTVNGKVHDVQTVSVGPDGQESLDFVFTGDRQASYKLGVGEATGKVTVVKPVRYANGHYLTRRAKGGSGKLKVKNGNKVDGVVVLTRQSARSVPVISTYVRANNSFTIEAIPDGKYWIYFSLGTDWNSHTKGFLATTRRGKFSDVATFKTSTSSWRDSTHRYTNTRYTRYRITLHGVQGGGATTEAVPESGFPQP